MDARISLPVLAKAQCWCEVQDGILVPYVCILVGVGPDLIFMKYNACPDRNHMVEEFLESEDIHLMDWLAKSPDLNHSEHVYEGLEKKIGIRFPPLKTI